MKIKLLLFSLVSLATGGSLFAQGIPYQLNPPAPNARVLFCPVPDGGYPCPSPVTVYSDSAATLTVAQPISIGSGGNLSVYFASGTTSWTVQLLGTGYGPQNRYVVAGSSSSSSPSSLTSVVSSGLMAEYRILPTETVASLVDYSNSGNGAVGTVGTAPTIATVTGGLVCTGIGAVKLPATLNSALTVQLYLSYPPNGNTQTTNGLLQGNGANAIQLVLYGSSVSDVWGPAINGNYRIRSTSPGNTFKSASRDLFAGTNALTYLLDTNDRFFIGTQETDYVQSSNSAGLQTNGQYQLCGLTPTYANATIFYAVFYNRVLTTAEIAQNVQYMTNAMAARNVPLFPFPPITDRTNQIVCDGDSLTAGGASYCNNIQGVGIPSNAVSNAFIAPIYQTNDQGKQGGGAATIQPATFTVDSAYRTSAANNIAALWIGTNDNLASLTYPLTRRYCTDRHKVGWKCIVGTMISRTSEDSTKNQLNALLRTHWPEFADGLMDFAANPNLGADGASANATYFSDGIHLTSTGSAIINNIGQRAIDRVYGNTPSSGAIQTAPPQFQVVQSAVTNCPTAASCTAVFPNANAAGNFIFVAALSGNNGAITTPTDTRVNTYSSEAASVVINSSNTMQAFYAPNIGAGANTVTVGWSASNSGGVVMAIEYSGVATVSPLDAASTNGTVTANAFSTNAVTTTAVNELLIAFAFTLGPAGTWSIGPSAVSLYYSGRINNSGTDSGALSDSLSNAAGAYTSTFTYSGTQARAGFGLAAFKVGTPAGTYAMADQDLFLYCNPSANTTAVNTTVTLPDAIGLTGQTITIKNTQNAGASTCTLSAVNSETIDGAATLVIANKATVTLLSVLTSPQAGGANWVNVNF